MHTEPEAPKQLPAVLTVTVQQEISLKRVGDLLCSAFEGGSNYWYMIEEFIKPPELSWLWDADYAEPARREARVYRHVDYPLNEGGALIVSDAKEAPPDDVRKERLDLAAVRRGLQVMATKYPRHFSNFIRENDDAETGDVFLQCCLWGTVIYG